MRLLRHQREELLETLSEAIDSFQFSTDGIKSARIAELEASNEYLHKAMARERELKESAIREALFLREALTRLPTIVEPDQIKQIKAAENTALIQSYLKGEIKDERF